MHVLFAFILSVLVVAGIKPVSAADLVEMPPLEQRAAPLVIYDYQPGVTVRAYWLEPWHRIHYFPKSGKKPKVGRVEDFFINTGRIQKPAESFQREWSTPSASANEEREEPTLDARAERDTAKSRVIHADAEVTILGPDRTSIQLFRKPRASDANSGGRIN
jgi:hypothetical protein